MTPPFASRDGTEATRPPPSARVGSWFWPTLGLAGLLIGHGPSLHAQPWNPDSPARGEALAQQYCQACHLLPSPDLLDRKTWATTTLRRMAPLLGAARLNFENRPDGAILKEAQIFPEQPLLPEEDWVAICQYYLRTAPETALPSPPRPPFSPATPLFKTELVSDARVEPGTSLVRIEPADRRFFLGDARRRSLHVLSDQGQWKSSTPVSSPPVCLTRNADHYLLTLIGDIFPSDLKSGQIVTLHPEPNTSGFSVRPLLSGLQRPVDCVLADLDSDGREDLVVAQFGNYLGKLSGFLRREPSRFIEDILVEFPGAIRTEVVDVNADRKPDLIILFGQAREGLYLLRNRGDGSFAWEPLLHLPSAYGSTGFELADFNGDGFPDILLTNGDNGDYPSPFKRYHGIRLLLNDGRYRFSQAWFFPLNGAFKAVARDFDRDGDLDIAAISFFPDYSQTPGESFVYLENQGSLRFNASTFPEANVGRWLTMDAGDLDGDGDTDLVLGSFIDGPRTVPIPPSLLEQWQTQRVAAVILRNTLVAAPASALKPPAPRPFTSPSAPEAR